MLLEYLSFTLGNQCRNCITFRETCAYSLLVWSWMEARGADSGVFKPCSDWRDFFYFLEEIENLLFLNLNEEDQPTFSFNSIQCSTGNLLNQTSESSLPYHLILINDILIYISAFYEIGERELVPQIAIKLRIVKDQPTEHEDTLPTHWQPVCVTRQPALL